MTKEASFFLRRFLEFVIENIKNECNITTEGKLKVLFFSFFEAAYVQVVEWWFKNEMPYPPHVMEVHIEILLDGNLVFPTEKIELKFKLALPFITK
ncbi:TetR-like C-terminal domain-containing protein [Bacillus atrophaeus]|uniref:TetR-like C-terminal domain-containing protein n=1 Tax=Bacillus atrophaeus TaxID=1452 RepID=UPI00227DE398|nr:TetR-like C-terminal domain-containing protein [Bacillus atrophaeus]